MVLSDTPPIAVGRYSAPSVARGMTMWAGCGLLALGFFALPATHSGLAAGYSAAALMASVFGESARAYVTLWAGVLLAAWPVSAIAGLLSLATTDQKRALYAARAAAVLALSVPLVGVLAMIRGSAPGLGLASGCAGALLVIAATGPAVRFTRRAGQ